jgi:hypothetical protein
MINQISPVAAKTGSLPNINRSLIQARHLQAQVKERALTGPLPSHVELWSPHTTGPYLVPVTRWIE